MSQVPSAIDPPLEVLTAGEPPGEMQLEMMPRADGIERFRPLMQVLEDHYTKALTLVITSADPPAVRALKTTEAARLRTEIFTPTRLAAGKLHKEVKAGLLTITQQIDGAERGIRTGCKKVEEHLLEVEQFEMREAMRLEDELRAARTEQLSPYLTGPCPHDLGKITGEEYSQLLADSMDLAQIRAMREKEARLAEEKRRAEAAAENERQRQEIARLKEEQMKKDEAHAAALAQERKKAEAAERQRKEAAAKAKKDMEAARAEREEAARIEREAFEARAKEREVELEKQRASERARQEAMRKAEAAPDVEKVREWAGAINAMQTPVLRDTITTEELRLQHAAYVRWIIRLGGKMEGRAS
jgi:DNA repair exonuclease SbcCD ATPase subunit